VARHRRPRDGWHLTQHTAPRPSWSRGVRGKRLSGAKRRLRLGAVQRRRPGLPGAKACLIELRGDNKQFKLSLLTDDGFDSLNYQASFTPRDANWQTLHLPLADFRASFRGREVTGAPPLAPARIRQVGLMIAARQAGPFRLHIRQICLT